MKDFDALMARELVAVFLDESLDLALLLGLGRGVVFAVRNNLCRYGGTESVLVRRLHVLELAV